MAVKYRTLFISTTNGKILVRGEMIRFEIDGTKVDFIIHRDVSTPNIVLTHAASGHKFGSISDTIEAHELSKNTKALFRVDHMSAREAAKEIVMQAVKTYGAKAIFTAFKSVPVINGNVLT